ncbi:MAG: hypothetical protein COW32_09965 [Candidatus Aquicultor secundus]|uniref:VWA domain-containing protein n=1 Tax=Candidatus Aquicultor secundus TaxID=1973895 RepID=A0A2M7T9B6_9ACTN|nr:hypothetical protein [Candidatus Aquicultor secundus]NCO65276.1 hypothetical protein [Solirubrobacter sp.]OIO83563.1 MAG: hypothetical protein AUK32_09870 [Candidatus Aquicultor secundus]PIU27233.1 MAG: hypothetical protein COT10_04465 [Candidatus Aquicultor secundus]PIW21449.1 MAG: hypothetical protein COW32_09965 [Candidatus Aquicultor secundus]PIX51681.1 MAG: hypothetical protein COZ51_08195 [Candidatus Aquicultor secundus]
MKCVKAIKTIVLVVFALILLGSVAGCATTEETPKKTVFALFDISGSTQQERGRYLKDFEKVLEAMNSGDTIVADKIDNSPLAKASYPVNTTFARGSVDPNENQAKAYIKNKHLPEVLKRQRAEVLSQARTLVNGESASTDILGALPLAERVFASYPNEKNVLIVFSDMYHQSGDYNFRSGAFEEAAFSNIIESVKQRDLLPNLKGVRVYIVCPTKDSSKQVMLVRKFWLRYFSRTGAAMAPQNYGSSLINFRER